MLVLALLIGVPFAASPMRSPAGTPLRLGENPWRPGPYLPLAGNPDNAAGISEDDVRDAVVLGLQRWEAASNGAVGFDYWQGTDPDVYVPGIAYDGLSSLSFLSNAPDGGSWLRSDAAGFTQLWYGEDDEEVIEVDVLINDVDFELTTDPALADQQEVLLLEDVITHELGHAFGLDHAASPMATMLSWPWHGQAALHCDDVVGLRQHYGSTPAGSGTLEGTVEGPDGQPLFAAHVQVISLERGTVVASALTDADGGYLVEGLEPGPHTVVVGPWLSGRDMLSASAYESLDHDLCGGQPFARTPLEEGGQLVVLDVGTETTADTLAVACGEGLQTQVVGTELLDDAPTIAIPASGAGWIDLVPTTSHVALDFEGTLRLSALAWSLHSAVSVSELALLDADGGVLAVADGPVFEDGQYTNQDRGLTTDVEPGQILRVTTETLPTDAWPQRLTFRDPSLFVVVLTAPPGSAELLPTDCVLDTTLASYSSPGGDPLRWDQPDEGKSCGCRRNPADTAFVLLPVLLWGRRRRSASSACDEEQR